MNPILWIFLVFSENKMAMQSAILNVTSIKLSKLIDDTRCTVLLKSESLQSKNDVFVSIFAFFRNKMAATAAIFDRILAKNKISPF